VLKEWREEEDRRKKEEDRRKKEELERRRIAEEEERRKVMEERKRKAAEEAARMREERKKWLSALKPGVRVLVADEMRSDLHNRRGVVQNRVGGNVFSVKVGGQVGSMIVTYRRASFHRMSFHRIASHRIASHHITSHHMASPVSLRSSTSPRGKCGSRK